MADICNKLVSNIPQMKIAYAIIVLVVNVIVPGVGTMLFVAFGGKENMTEHILIGVLQLLGTFIFIGWIWSILWGVFAFDKARAK